MPFYPFDNDLLLVLTFEHKWFSFSENIRIVSAETVPVRMFSGNQYGNHETTYTWNRGEQKEVWLLVVRIFLDGDYLDPPPDMLPPPPANLKNQDNCCVILWQRFLNVLHFMTISIMVFHKILCR